MPWVEFGEFRIVNYGKDTIFDKTDFLLEMTKPYVYRYKGKDYSNSIGDVSDGASIPDVFKKIAGDNFQNANSKNLEELIKAINSKGSYVPAAFIHDIICKRGLEGNPVCSWEDAHNIFYSAMIENGVPKFSGFLGLGGAWAKYQAVKIGMYFKRWKY